MKTKLMCLIVAVIVVVGCTVPVKVTGPDGIEKIEHRIDPRLESGLNIVGTAGGTLPQPWGWIIGSGAAIAGAVAQTLAKRKNAEKANKMEDIATTIIQGIESAGEAAAAVKKSVADRAATDGNSAAVHELVQKETS